MWKLADQVQRIQIRRIERDVFETEELTRRCLRLLSGGGGGDDVEDGSGGSDGSDSDGGGGGLRRRRRSGVGGGDGWGSVKSRKSTSLPPVGRRARSVGGREVVVEEREAMKVRGDTTTTNGERAPAAGRRNRRGSRYEFVRPERDSSGRIVVDVGGPVDVERRRERDRDRDRYR